MAFVKTCRTYPLVALDAQKVLGVIGLIARLLVVPAAQSEEPEL